MQFIITCLPGLAPLLADELTELGMSVTDRGNAHVAVEGRQQDGLRACLWSRLAERVLLPLAELEAGKPSFEPSFSASNLTELLAAQEESSGVDAGSDASDELINQLFQRLQDAQAQADKSKAA